LLGAAHKKAYPAAFCGLALICAKRLSNGSFQNAAIREQALLLKALSARKALLYQKLMNSFINRRSEQTYGIL